MGAEPIIKGGSPPEQEKVVEVKHSPSSLAGDVATAYLDYLFQNIARPWRHFRGYCRDGAASVDSSRIEVEEKRLAWEPLTAGLRVTALFSNEVDDVGIIRRCSRSVPSGGCLTPVRLLSDPATLRSVSVAVHFGSGWRSLRES
jgi:hypothetical protein